MPLALKAIVDESSADQAATAAAASQATRVVYALPVFLLLAYALLRFASTLFTELRDLAFARATLDTVSDFAQRTFAHLLSLGPGFHSQRSTGTLIRDVERGTAGIAFVLGAGLFTVLPTLVEFCAVLVVMLAASYSVWFIVTIVVTFFVYAGYTAMFTRRREQRQRTVNEIDSRTQGVQVDSLLNAEHATPEGSRVEIRLERHDVSARASITDVARLPRRRPTRRPSRLAASHRWTRWRCVPSSSVKEAVSRSNSPRPSTACAGPSICRCERWRCPRRRSWPPPPLRRPSSRHNAAV